MTALWQRLLPAVALFPILLVMGGCARKVKVVYVPAPPPPTIPYPRTTTPPAETRPPAVNVPPAAAESSNSADEEYVATHSPIMTEEGLASWYGPPYHNRRGANGQVFDQNALTAAHRTLPMNSLIKVTNLQTGQFVVARVTDRGPFVQGRLLDLSMASAKAAGVWRPGTARVRVDVYQTPLPVEVGGRWCVQVGAFKDGEEALKLRDHLQRKYHTANVIEFTGPTGHWVRIRPQNDDKGKAQEIARELDPVEGNAYLVRLD
ncbi:MAG TPA: septal ring lytic transglycosylase RlpA family protein [Acidisarcina sp.]|nr:septal ring lytic transglycosylase RlpA family protein [Acidisarcina sp.]